MTISCAVLTVSDRASTGEYADETGPAVCELLREKLQAVVVETAIVPDDEKLIVDRLLSWCDRGDVELIVTNGGTGLTSRDVTPEAVRQVIHREIPGIAEAMRAAGRMQTSLADLSRQVVGHRGGTLVVSVPGSPQGASESLQSILPILPHAIELIRK